MKFSRCILTFLILLLCFSVAWAHNSKEWKERIDARTITLWVEGQDIGGIVLNARGELNVTWVERNLSRRLDQDRDVEEWLINGINYYSSNRKEIRAKLKKRDVFVLNYRAVKNWNFDPAKLVIGKYAILPDDILTKKEYWESDDLPSGTVGTVAICAPSLKPGEKIEIRYEDARAVFEVPGK